MLFGVPVGQPAAAPSPAQTSPFGFGFGQQQQQQQQPTTSPPPAFGQPVGFPPSSAPPSQREVFGVHQGPQHPAGGTGHTPAFGAGSHQAWGRQPKQQQHSPPVPQFGQPAGNPPSTSPPNKQPIVFGVPQGSQGPANVAIPPPSFGTHQQGPGGAEQPAETEETSRRDARMHRFGKGGGASNGKNRDPGTAPLSKQQQRKQQRQQQQQRQDFGSTEEPTEEEEVARRNARLSRFGGQGAAGAAAGSAAESMDGGVEDDEMAPPTFRFPFGGDSGLGGRAMMDDDIDGADVYVLGTCEDMCPAKQREDRARCGELHPFERVEHGNTKLTSRDLIIKRHVRNYKQEDQIPPNFRTLGALDKTMRHLRRIMDWTTKDHPSAEPIVIYQFLWDRYREVRKEIVTQRFNTNPINLPQVMAWNEEVARYFIACSHELINTMGFCAILNQEQLNKVLMDLLSDYRTCVDLGVPTPCAGEFKCYMAIMTYFGLENKSGKKVPNKFGAFEVLRSFTAQEQEDSWFPVTLGILTTLANRDVHAYIQLAKAAPYPLACVLYMHYGDMKEHGFRITPHVYNASEDPENVVPVPALAPMFDLTTKGISAKCTSMGAELGPYPEDPSIEAVRFPDPSTLVYTSRKKQVKKQVPWISNKGSARAGQPSAAIVNPPTLSQALLDLVARIQGKPPGTLNVRLQPPSQPQHPLVSKPSPAQVRPSTSLFGLTQTPQPTLQPLQQKQQAPLTPSPFSVAPSQQPVSPRGPPAFGATPSSLPTSFPAPARAPSAGPAAFGAPVSPAFGGSGQQSAGIAPGGVPQPGGAAGLGGAAALPPAQPASPAATAEAVAQAQAAAEAAISHAKAQEAQARQAQEALQQKLQAQAQQQQQQHRVHMQQYMRQLEELQRSAAQQSMALQLQVAAQSAQLAALAEQRQRAEAELHKRRARDQGEKLRAALENSLLQRTTARWRAVTSAQKEREARAQEQLARCRIDKVARGTASPALRRPPHTPGASPDTLHIASGKRRRQEGLLYSPSTLYAAPPFSSSPSTPTPVPSHLPLPSIILPELRATLFHASTSAAAAAAAAFPSSANPATTPLPGAYGSPVRTAAWGGGLKAGLMPRTVHGNSVQQPARQAPMFWKLVVSTGVSDGSCPSSSAEAAQGGTTRPAAAAPSPPPVSSLQLAAASWLRAKLACGRSGAIFQPPSGKLLTLLNVPLDPEDALRKAPFAVPSHATLCVEDLNPRAVAADPPPLPRYSSSSMAATAGILLLVSGPSPPSHTTTPSVSPSPSQAVQHRPVYQQEHYQQHSTSQASSPASSPSANGSPYVVNSVYDSPSVNGDGGRPRSRQEEPLSLGVQAELAGSWEDLKGLLSGLAPGVQVPLTVLALTDAGGVPAVRNHLEATARRWPSELTARVARCMVLPLLPQHLAEAGLIQGLRHLATHPPAPLLAASCCSGAFWGSGLWTAQRGSPQALADAGRGCPQALAGGMWGAPQRAGLESLVRDLLEVCLLQQEQEQGLESSTQDVVHTFNDGLAALAHGVHSTATCPAASWGLPAPETSPSSHTAAPLCWHPASVDAAVQDLLSAQVPPQSLLPSLMGPHSAASLLHAHFAQWASFRTGPSHCLLLPQFLATATPPSSLPHTAPSATSQGRLASSFLARSPGGFVRAASALAPTARHPSTPASTFRPPQHSQMLQQAEWPSSITSTPAEQRQQQEHLPPFSHATLPTHAPSTPVVTLGLAYPFLEGKDVARDTQLSSSTPGSALLKSRAERILLQLGHLVPDSNSSS